MSLSLPKPPCCPQHGVDFLPAECAKCTVAVQRELEKWSNPYYVHEHRCADGRLYHLGWSGELLVKAGGYSVWNVPPQPGATPVEEAQRILSNLQVELQCAKHAGADEATVTAFEAAVTAATAAVTAAEEVHGE